MKIFSLSQLEDAVSLLKQGGVLVYPTETSYALGCDAANAAAVAKVFAIKGRPDGKGLPIILPSDVNANRFVLMGERAYELATLYWPGPLNIVARRAEGSPVSLRCETDGTQSVRQSSNIIAAKLARLLGSPLVATSANKSGDAAIYRPDEARVEFAGSETGQRPVFTAMMPDAMIDAGNLPVVPASTTAKIVDDRIETIRQGSIVL